MTTLLATRDGIPHLLHAAVRKRNTYRLPCTATLRTPFPRIKFVGDVWTRRSTCLRGLLYTDSDLSAASTLPCHITRSTLHRLLSRGGTCSSKARFCGFFLRFTVLRLPTLCTAFVPRGAGQQVQQDRWSRAGFPLTFWTRGASRTLNSRPAMVPPCAHNARHIRGGNSNDGVYTRRRQGIARIAAIAPYCNNVSDDAPKSARLYSSQALSGALHTCGDCAASLLPSATYYGASARGALLLNRWPHHSKASFDLYRSALRAHLMTQATSRIMDTWFCANAQTKRMAAVARFDAARRRIERWRAYEQTTWTGDIRRGGRQAGTGADHLSGTGWTAWWTVDDGHPAMLSISLNSFSGQATTSDTVDTRTPK